MLSNPSEQTLWGVLPEIPTLFTSENKIDVAAQCKVVSFAIENGAAAVVCPAVASEYNFLIDAQYLKRQG